MKPSALLYPLVPFYTAGITLRNRLYDAGVFKQHSLGVPVISVGNITAGGTGKTPVVELLIRLLTSRGKRIGVLSRGYGRESADRVILPPGGDRNTLDVRKVGDEIAQLARQHPPVLFGIDADRYGCGKAALAIAPLDACVLDDGFQHRGLRRDLDIVLIDSTRRSTEEPMLPAGLRREPISSLTRAGLVAYTRADQQWVADTLTLSKQRDGLKVEFVPTCWIDASTGSSLPLASLAGELSTVFSGIGNPDSLISSILRLNVTIAETRIFPDHHWYSDSEIDSILGASHDSAAVLTTEKDLARLTPGMLSKFGTGRLYALRIAARITAGEQLLSEKLNSLGL